MRSIFCLFFLILFAICAQSEALGYSRYAYDQFGRKITIDRAYQQNDNYYQTRAIHPNYVYQNYRNFNNSNVHNTQKKKILRNYLLRKNINNLQNRLWSGFAHY